MLAKIASFYLDGFRSMKLGRTLWKLILIKLLLMFAVVKVMFFPDILQSRFDTDAARAEHVIANLTRSAGSTP